MRTRLALFAVVATTAFPSAALADDQPAPADPQSPPPPACLAAQGQAPDATSVRGVHVGGRAVIKDASGNPLKVNSVQYCVNGGGIFSFALSQESDVVLALSTSEGDSIGAVNPTSPWESARMEFPKMKRIVKSARGTSVYRLDTKRQLILGITDGRVTFVAAADRLLLDYPSKLGYYLRRLGF